MNATCKARGMSSPSYVLMLSLCLLPPSVYAGGTGNVCDEEWPAVLPAKVMSETSEMEGFGVSLPLVDASGKQLYVIHCRDGSHNAVDGENYSYSGLLNCALFDASSKGDSLLQDDDAASDWDTRARFRAEHLSATNAPTPEWGSKRIFTLRGMTLTMVLQEVDSETSTKYRFDLEVVPNEVACSASPQRPSSSKPVWF